MDARSKRAMHGWMRIDRKEISFVLMLNEGDKEIVDDMGVEQVHKERKNKGFSGSEALTTQVKLAACMRLFLAHKS